jgi:hypothetical protein
VSGREKQRGDMTKYALADPEHKVTFDLRAPTINDIEGDTATIKLTIGRRVYRFEIHAYSTGPSDAAYLEANVFQGGRFDYERTDHD